MLRLKTLGSSMLRSHLTIVPLINLELYHCTNNTKRFSNAGMPDPPALARVYCPFDVRVQSQKILPHYCKTYLSDTSLMSVPFCFSPPC